MPEPVADSVRLAWPSEAGAIAALQRRGWGTLPRDVGEPLLAGVAQDEMTQAWTSVITRPAEARQRVLVGLDGVAGRVVAFATTVPNADADGDALVDGEVDQFWVDPAAQGRGHGSRLLNACADTLRADGFGRARWWVLSADDDLRRFLVQAGWAADGAHRELGSDDGAVRLRQIRLHTDLGE